MSYTIDFDRPRAAVEQLNERRGDRVSISTWGGTVHTGKLVGASAHMVRLTNGTKRIAVEPGRIRFVRVLAGSWVSATAHGKHTKTSRFTVRLRPEELVLLQRAARISGMTMSTFVLRSAITGAKTLLNGRGKRTVPS